MFLTPSSGFFLCVALSGTDTLHSLANTFVDATYYFWSRKSQVGFSAFRICLLCLALMAASFAEETPDEESSDEEEMSAEAQFNEGLNVK